jgi:hypothetical protein
MQGATLAEFRSGANMRTQWLLFATSLVAPLAAQIFVPPNTNNQPGSWSPAFDHGPHLVGCAGAGNTTRFYPIHAALIPKGPYQGCVLVWERGDQIECRFSNPVPHPFGGVWLSP